MKSSRSRYSGYCFPPEIISYAVWAYHRFCLSFRDVEDLLAERGIIVSYESIRQWCQKFGADYARRLKRREGRLGDCWHLDEIFLRINGKLQYLWRAVDQDGDVIDILVRPRRDQRAAERFFRRLLRGQGIELLRIVTDKLRSYAAAIRTIFPNVPHILGKYANNRAEASHQWTRQRERQMRRFKSARHAQRFLSLHDAVQNLFRVGRHLLTSSNHRLWRSRSFAVWREVTAACAIPHTPNIPVTTLTRSLKLNLVYSCQARTAALMQEKAVQDRKTVRGAPMRMFGSYGSTQRHK